MSVASLQKYPFDNGFTSFVFFCLAFRAPYIPGSFYPCTFWGLWIWEKVSLVSVSLVYFKSEYEINLEFREVFAVLKGHTDFLHCCSSSAVCQPSKDLCSSLKRKDIKGLLVTFIVIWKDGKISWGPVYEPTRPSLVRVSQRSFSLNIH